MRIYYNKNVTNSIKQLMFCLQQRQLLIPTDTNVSSLVPLSESLKNCLSASLAPFFFLFYSFALHMKSSRNDVRSRGPFSCQASPCVLGTTQNLRQQRTLATNMPMNNSGGSCCLFGSETVYMFSSFSHRSYISPLRCIVLVLPHQVHVTEFFFFLNKLQ